MSSSFLRGGKPANYVTARPNSLRPSCREVKNDVWKYLQTIVMGLYAACEQKLAHPDRVLSLPLSPGRNFYLPTQSQASYRSTSSSPSACRHASYYDVDNEEVDARENVIVVDGHADERTSAEMTDVDNDDDADDGDFNDTLGETFSASFMATPSLDLDLDFSVVDSNVTRSHPLLLSALPPPPSPRENFAADATKKKLLLYEMRNMVVENGQSVVCKLIPQTRWRLGLAALGFGRP